MAFKKLKLWFDKDLALMLGEKITAIDPSFDTKKFAKNVDRAVQPLELKDRVEYMADELYAMLGSDFQAAAAVLHQIMGPENEEETGMFTEFYWLMPVAKLVEKYGLDNFKEAMHLQEEVTKRNTAEYSIRPYIERYPAKTIGQMKKWSKSKNFHLRRLASEGGRPRLPWAPKLQQFIDDPAPLLPILDNLKDDPSKYVQKSVANCLNDILKDNFDTGKKLVNGWVPKAGKERKWIIKHGLRNFIKKEDPAALAILKKLK